MANTEYTKCYEIKDLLNSTYYLRYVGIEGKSESNDVVSQTCVFVCVDKIRIYHDAFGLYRGIELEKSWDIELSRYNTMFRDDMFKSKVKEISDKEFQAKFDYFTKCLDMMNFIAGI